MKNTWTMPQPAVARSSASRVGLLPPAHRLCGTRQKPRRDHPCQQQRYSVGEQMRRILKLIATKPANAAIAAAVRLEIDAYHHQMRIWRREMSAEEWQRLRVVVVEAPQARRGGRGRGRGLLRGPRRGGPGPLW